MSKKTETLQDYLDGKVTEENGNIENAVNTKTEKKDKKKNKKSKIVALIALILAGVTAIGCAIGFKNKKNKNNDYQPTITTTQVSIDDLGTEEEFPTNSQYGNTTGNVKKEDIVEKNGKYYVDKESADKSDKVGQTHIDDKNGTLEVKPDGTVVEKETGYEVIDETGEVVDKGNNEEDLLDEYIVLDKDYYYKDGTPAFKKGDRVKKEDFERVKKYLITDLKDAIKIEETTKTSNTTQPTTTQPTTTTSQEGKVNPDGTYTIYGTTYMDKATFEAFILDENSNVNFGYYNGVIYPISVINEKTNQK